LLKEEEQADLWGAFLSFLAGAFFSAFSALGLAAINDKSTSVRSVSSVGERKGCMREGKKRTLGLGLLSDLLLNFLGHLYIGNRQGG
jgi:hypothetical protein